MPPQTIITAVVRLPGKMICVTGTTADNAEVAGVKVNGVAARTYQPNLAEWTVELPLDDSVKSVTAVSTDAAGNVEKTPHTFAVEDH